MAAARVAQACRKVVSHIIPLTQPSEGEEDEAESCYLLLLIEPKRRRGNPGVVWFSGSPTLDEHSDQAAASAERIADALCWRSGGSRP